jgi:hypothetical protein
MGNADGLAVEAQSEHNKDIIQYARDKLAFNEPDIEEEIIRKADHVFLWVELVVKMLNEGSNSGIVWAIKEVFREIPSDLNNLYSELLSKGVDSKKINKAYLCLNGCPLRYDHFPQKSCTLPLCPG